MRVPQAPDPMAGGRQNQKRRTRTAIVLAARELMAEGFTPTVQQAAERSLVSRTTAYRYFPTQESLLIEVAVNVDVDEIENLVALPVDKSDARERTIEILDTFNRHVVNDEIQYRASLRLYLDMWLAARAHGEAAPVVREGRRHRWITTTLDPLRDSLTDHEFDRLVAALAVVAGSEAMIVLRDVCQIGDESALDVSSWAANALISAALGTTEHR